MVKHRNKILWILTFLPLIITAVALMFMPDNVPMHYNSNGQIDRWGSKNENYIFPCMIVLITLFWKGLIRYYKNKQIRLTEEKAIKEAVNNENVLYIVACSMAFMYCVMQCFILYGAFEVAGGTKETPTVELSDITNVMMGIFFIFVGNVLPKAKKNSLMGIGTVWSNHNDITWAKTHRFGGAALVLCGILTIAQTFIVGGIKSTFIMVGILLVWMVVVMYYSYKVYCKYKNSEGELQ